MDCRICGRQFDALGFQVMVPGSQHAFDRVDCALEASVLEAPSTHRGEPEPPVVAAPSPSFGPIPALASGPSLTENAVRLRPNFFGGANIALLAAGTAATIYLWLRVFGVDAGPVAFLAERVSQAFGRTSVAAAVDLTPTTEVRPEPGNTARGAGTGPAAAATAAAASDDDRGRTAVADRSPRKKQGDDRKPRGGPVVRPAPTPPPAEPPAEPSPPRSAPTPTTPVPSSPPDDRVPGPTLPGGQNPEQPTLPGGRP